MAFIFVFYLKKKFKFTFFCSSMMFFGTLLFELGTCPGYVMFLDFEGSKWGHLFKLQLRVCRAGVRFVQEALPVRIKV